MADLAQLGLTVDGNGAVQKLKEFSGVSDKAGQSTDALTAKLKQQDQALRALAERGTIASDTGKRMAQSIIAQNGGMERYLQIQRQIAQEMRVADEVAKQHSATMMKLNATTDGGHLAVGRLRQGLSSLAAQVTGLNPQIASLTSVLGSFALGSGPLVAILAGIAAISYAYNKLTSDTRKAKEETESFIESLRRSAQAAKDATVSGAEARAGQARQLEAEAKAAQRRFNETGGGPSWQANLVTGRVTQATADRILAEANAAKVLAAANDQIRDAANRADAAIAAVGESVRQSFKTIDAENLRNAIERIKVAVDALKNSASFRIDFGAGVSTNIESRLAYEDFTKDAAARNAAQPPTMIQLTPQQKQDTDAFYLLLTGAKTAAVETDRMAKAMSAAAQVVSQSAEYLLVSKFGGGGVAGSLGGGVGKAISTGLGGFGGTAVGGAIFGPLFAGAGAAIGNFIGGLFDSGKAAREHAAAQKALTESMASFHANATGTSGSLEELIRQIHATAAALRAQTAAAMPHGGWGNSPAQNAAYAAAIAQIAADEALYVARLKEEDRLKKQYYDEDLDVRLLRATGRGKEADDLAFKQKQDRERQALIDSFGPTIDAMEAERLAKLNVVLAAEKLAKSFDALTTSMRNAPSGFKLESYINRFAAGRPWEPPLGMPYNPGRPSMPYPKGGITSGGTTVNIGTVSLSLPNVTTPEKVGPAFMTYIRKVQLQTVGPNAPLADAMEYAS